MGAITYPLTLLRPPVACCAPQLPVYLPLWAPDTYPSGWLQAVQEAVSSVRDTGYGKGLKREGLSLILVV